MKYIITEEQNTKLQIVRRLDEIWEFIHNLYPWQYPCDFHSLGHFTIALRVEMFEVFSLDWFNSDNESVVWDVVTQVYGDKIKEHYEGWCEDKESINETKHEYLRRLPEFDRLIKSSLSLFDNWNNPRVDFNYMLNHLASDVAEMYYFKTQDDIHVGGDEYDELIDFLKIYLEKNWKDKIQFIINPNKKGGSINESKSPRIRRVLHIVKEFIDLLDPNDICDFWDRDEGDSYVNQAMSELIDYLNSAYLKDSDFDELYDELVEYGVRMDITEFFYDTIDSCIE